MGNPFKQQMVKMKFPEGSGGTLSVAGFLLEAEEDGCVDVPREYVEGVKSHGLTEAPVSDEPQEAPKAARGRK